MSRKLPAAALLLSLLVTPAAGDGILLNDGRKLIGKVVEKPDGYEVTVEGQTLSFAKEDVKKWIKHPREVIGDADRLIEEAKRLYTEAVEMQDLVGADAKFREALIRVTRAREAYAEARDLFPDGHPELDLALINIMKLMRLIRERIGSQMAGPPSVVKAKDAPPPRPAPVAPPAAPKAPPPAGKPSPPPAEPSPEPPKEGTPLPAPEPQPGVTLAEAFAILMDPARRADDSQRGQARILFRKAAEAKNPLSDVATAGFLFLSRPDEDWQLLTDTVQVKGPGGEQTYKGRLLKRSEGLSALVLPDGREVKIRKAADATYVTAPGGSEAKAADCTITPDQKSDAFVALQDFFKGLGSTGLESLSDRELGEAVKFLSMKVKELRSKAPEASVDALSLFVAGPASSLVAKNGGKPTVELEAAFRDLGFEKSEFGAVWGPKEGLAMDDYRKWLMSGEYGLAIVQFQNDYKGLADFNVRYALGLLMIFKAIADNRNYNRAAAYLELQSRSAAPTLRDHLLALAKSIRSESPCMACGGTHKVNCSACKGKKKLNLECTKCGGSGKLNTFRGVAPCVGCQGRGRFNNVDCPKCKTAGTTECKAKGCVAATKAPTLESFADAYTCQLCKGKGTLMRHVAYACPDCEGIGLHLQPKSDPTKLIK
jgi:hypothetical protein